MTHAARTQVPRLTSVAAKMSGALSKISKKYNKKEIFSLKAVFDEADADGSGEIDSSELRKALSKSSLSAAAVDMFKALDKDGSKRIGFDEYLKVRARGRPRLDRARTSRSPAWLNKFAQFPAVR